MWLPTIRSPPERSQRYPTSFHTTTGYFIRLIAYSSSFHPLHLVKHSLAAPASNRLPLFTSLCCPAPHIQRDFPLFLRCRSPHIMKHPWLPRFDDTCSFSSSFPSSIRFGEVYKLFIRRSRFTDFLVADCLPQLLYKLVKFKKSPTHFVMCRCP